MNPYASRRQHLKLVCLPISPPPHEGELIEYTKTWCRRSDGRTDGSQVALFAENVDAAARPIRLYAPLGNTPSVIVIVIKQF